MIRCVVLLFFLSRIVFAEEVTAEQFWRHWRGKYWSNWKEELREKIEKQEFPAWMLEQIHEDLRPFREKGIDQQEIPNTVMANWDMSFIVCSICLGQVICTTYPVEAAYDFRAKVFMEVLQELSRAIHLPDVVFLVSVGDSFCRQSGLPVFAWCKHREQSPFTVNIPDYEALNGNDNLLVAVEKGAQLYPWESKENTAIWRGSTTGYNGPLKFPPIKTDFVPRQQLVDLSLAYPQYVDAKFSIMFKEQAIDESWTARFAPYMGDSLQVSEQLKYKYQVLVDGFVSAFSRAYWQFFSNSVTFKQQSLWYQWFYRILRPYEHYIPYEAEGNDLIEKIRWAIDHDDEARAIMHNANRFAQENLKRSDVMLYFYLVIREYAKLQKFYEERKRRVAKFPGFVGEPGMN